MPYERGWWLPLIAFGERGARGFERGVWDGFGGWGELGGGVSWDQEDADLVLDQQELGLPRETVMKRIFEMKLVEAEEDLEDIAAVDEPLKDNSPGIPLEQVKKNSGLKD